MDLTPLIISWIFLWKPCTASIFPHQQLVKDILDPDKYDRNVRPVFNHSTPVVVKMRMNLYQLLDVNEPNQNLKLYVWVTQYWTDAFLGWDPKEYEGISQIIIPHDKVWLPDTYLYNNLEMQRENTERWISVIYYTNATVTEEEPKPRANAVFQYPAIFTYTCKMDILYFPFDQQNCTMVFGSWTNDKAGIDYYPFRRNVTNESFVPNEEWEIIDFHFVREDVYYDCCIVPYPVLKVHLVIKRKALYYVVNLVIPTSIITLIAIVGFFMPASTSGERTEKVNLGITTLLAMSILLLMVSDQMPTTSNFVPMVGWFFLSIIIIISLGTALTAVIICIHQKGNEGKRVPKHLRTIFFHGIGCIVCVQPPPLLRRTYTLEREKNKANVLKENGVKLEHPTDDMDYGEEHQLVTIFGKSNSPTRAGFSSSPLLGGPSSFMQDSTMSQLAEIQRKLEQIRSMMFGEDVENVGKLEWEHLANVLDRMFLILFTSAVALVTVSLLLVGSLTNQDLQE